jgi:hypothetical protein
MDLPTTQGDAGSECQIYSNYSTFKMMVEPRSIVYLSSIWSNKAGSIPRGGLRGTGVPSIQYLPMHPTIQEMLLLGVFHRNGE